MYLLHLSTEFIFITASGQIGSLLLEANSNPADGIQTKL